MVLWLLACTGSSTPTDSSTDRTDVAASTGDTASDTGGPSLELGSAPAQGAIVASLEFDGSEAVVTCPVDGPAQGYGLVSVTQSTLNFNKLNHTECTTDSPDFVTFAFLNVPLVDSTSLPLMDGTAPVDVTMEYGGVQSRRGVHDSTGQAWTVTEWGSGTLSATFVATWPDGRLRVWFDEAPMVER